MGVPFTTRGYTRKPNDFSRPNLGHPLLAGAKLWVPVFGNGVPRDVIGGRVGESQNNSTVSFSQNISQVFGNYYMDNSAGNTATWKFTRDSALDRVFLEQFSVSCWFTVPFPTNDHVILGKIDSGTGAWWRLWVDNDRPIFETDDGTTKLLLTGNSDFDTDYGALDPPRHPRWFHMAATWKKEGNQIAYIMGVQDGTISAQTNEIEDNADNLYFGNNPTQPTVPAVSLHDVIIYDREISPSHIYDLYQGKHYQSFTKKIWLPVSVTVGPETGEFVDSIAATSAFGATAIASALVSGSVEVSEGEQPTAFAVTDFVGSGEAADLMEAIAAASAAIQEGALAGEDWVSTLVGGNLGEFSAGTQASESFLAAVQVIASLIDNVDLDAIMIPTAQSFADILEGITVSDIFTSVVAGLLGEWSEGSAFTEMVMATTQAGAGFSSGFGASDQFVALQPSTIIGHLIIGSIAVRATLMGIASNAPAIKGTPSIN